MGFADRHYERHDANRPSPGPWQSIAIPAAIWLIALHLATYLFCVLKTPTVASGPGQMLAISRDVIYPDFELWRLITYCLAQDNLLAIVFNMAILFFIVRLLDMLWGWRRVIAAYFFCALTGGLAAAVIAPLLPLSAPLFYGASAPILGLIAAAITHLHKTNSSQAYTNLPFSLPTFAAILVAFQGVMIFLAHASWLALPACAVSALAGYAWVAFDPKTKNLAALFPAKNPALTPPGPNSPATYAVRPSDKTIEDDARNRELEELDHQVDLILEKVARHSINSLTDQERQILKRATDLKNQKPSRR